RGPLAPVPGKISSAARQGWQTSHLFRRQFVRADAESGPGNCRSGTGRLGETRRRRAPRREDAMVFVPRDVARTDRAHGRRKTSRSDLHEQPDGESSPDDGDVLLADEIKIQNLNGKP